MLCEGAVTKFRNWSIGQAVQLNHEQNIEPKQGNSYWPFRGWYAC
jgi:hypothetical protein